MNESDTGSQSPPPEVRTGLPHEFDHTHSDVSSGWLRAAFGAMDGLVSNTALIAWGGAERTALRPDLPPGSAAYSANLKTSASTSCLRNYKLGTPRHRKGHQHDHHKQSDLRGSHLRGG
jgi:hypothetical protein